MVGSLDSGEKLELFNYAKAGLSTEASDIRMVAFAYFNDNVEVMP